MSVNGHNGWRNWILGIAAALLTSGVVAAIAQSQDAAVRAENTQTRVGALEAKEPQREQDSRTIVRIESKLERIDEKLEELLDKLDKK